MINLDSYIVEKLKINKDTKLELDKEYLVGEICYNVKHVLEDDYKTSSNYYKIEKIDERKCIVTNNKEVWYISVKIEGTGSINENFISSISNSLRISLKDLIDKWNIVPCKISDREYNIKIFLYDPEN